MLEAITTLLLGGRCRSYVGLRRQGLRCVEERLHEGDHRALLPDGLTVVRWNERGAWCDA